MTAIIEDQTDVKAVMATVKPEPESEAETQVPSPKKARKVVKKVTTKVKTEVKVEEEVVKTKAKTKRKAIKNEEADDEELAEDEDGDKKPAPKKRKTKAEKEAEENMIFAPRTAVSSLKRSMFIGAHVSGAGGIQNSVQNALKIGANSFALFLKSQRKWESPPLADENRDAWQVKVKELGYDAAKHVLPHGSYLVNLAQVEKDKADQAYGNFIDDLKRCEVLGIGLYNFHPGSTGGDTKEAAIGRIAAQLNRAHKETEKVVTVLECMCGSGNVIGSAFEELRDIIALVEDKTRVGVCIDTCHAFAAGYDFRTPEAFDATMSKFDEVVGMAYLKAIHCRFGQAISGCPPYVRLTCVQ
jgi:AP endonuclease-1